MNTFDDLIRKAQGKIDLAFSPEEQVRLEKLYTKSAAGEMVPFLGPIVGHLIRGGLSKEEVFDYFVLHAKACLEGLEALEALKK